MSQIYIEVDQKDLHRVMSKLKDMEKAPRHLKNAINRTATVATIRAKGKPPTLQSFKTKFPKAGGKADITKSGLKRLVTATGGAAFVPSGGKAAGLMAQRRGKERHPIKVLYGNSVPKMVEQIYKGERGGQGDMEKVIKKRLHDEIQAEIAKIM